MENKKIIMEEARKMEALKIEFEEALNDALDDAIFDIDNDQANDFYEEWKSELDSSTYICDAITEFADDQVSIYTDDLFDWARDNYNIIEDANDELGTPSDILAQIRQAQFYEANNELYEDIDNVIKALIYYELKDQVNYKDIALTMEDLEKIINEVEYQTEVDANSRFSDIYNFVSGLLDDYIIEE